MIIVIIITIIYICNKKGRRLSVCSFLPPFSSIFSSFFFLLFAVGWFYAKKGWYAETISILLAIIPCLFSSSIFCIFLLATSCCGALQASLLLLLAPFSFFVNLCKCWASSSLILLNNAIISIAGMAVRVFLFLFFHFCPVSC